MAVSESRGEEENRQEFREFYQERTGLVVGVNEHLCSCRSEFQKIDVFETDSWGRMLVLDGMVMLSEKDEFVYHEMLVHVPLFSHSDPRKILIIGGGDGGSAREVLRHSAVEKVDLVEIDEAVIDTCRRWMPEIGRFDDTRMTIHIEDGAGFVSRHHDAYDVILIDGSDPAGPAESLFSEDFFEACCDALRDDGVLAAQMESPWVEKYHPAIRNSYRALKKRFEHTGLYLSSIPLYPAGLWAMICASMGDEPAGQPAIERSRQEAKRLGALKYYSPEIHQSAFVLPPFVRAVIE